VAKGGLATITVANGLFGKQISVSTTKTRDFGTATEITTRDMGTMTWVAPEAIEIGSIPSLSSNSVGNDDEELNINKKVSEKGTNNIVLADNDKKGVLEVVQISVKSNTDETANNK